MSASPEKWYIDTLDGRGGMAFASWRTNDLLSNPALLNRPTYYFSPPAFTPIPIASSSTALAAERFGFQCGLFDEKGEIPFDDISEVAEFVRRVYLGSGRSDGTDGGPIVPIVPPDGEPPDARLHFETLPHNPLSDQAKRFGSQVNSTERGTAKLFHWNLSDTKDAHWRQALLMRGAALTLTEMLSRFPNHGSELEAWETAASRLAATLIAMGGTVLLQDHQLIGPCQRFIRSAAKALELHWLADEGKDFPIEWTISAMLGHGDWRDWWSGPLPYLGEPLDDLAHFPISKAHASTIGARDPARSSIAELVSSILASPGLLESSRDLEAILTFGAARIVSYQAAPWEALGRARWWSARTSTRSQLRSVRLSIAACKWLESELPRLSFSPSLEQLIQLPVSP